MKTDIWGVEASIDLKGCDPKIIRDAKEIKKYVDRLCFLIDMKKFGETTVVDFGEDPKVSGFSMTQLIETSLISGHFVNQTNNVYLNIFSCKPFDCMKAAKFSQKFFKADQVEVIANYRMI